MTAATTQTQTPAAPARPGRAKIAASNANLGVCGSYGQGVGNATVVGSPIKERAVRTYGVRRCRSRGNSATSRMFSARVSRLVQRSRPIANPPCGGLPCAKASR